MKRFTTVVLMLCIAMMCTTPFEVQGQNRRTGGNSNTSTSKTKSTESTLKARPAESRSSQTTAAPQRKESQKAAPQRNSQTTQRSSQATQQHRSAPAPQVQDRRNTTNAKPSGSNSHSAQIKL